MGDGRTGASGMSRVSSAGLQGRARVGVDLGEQRGLARGVEERGAHRVGPGRRRPARSRPSSRAATAYSWLRSVENIGGSSELIVTGRRPRPAPAAGARPARAPSGCRRWRSGRPRAGSACRRRWASSRGSWAARCRARSARRPGPSASQIGLRAGRLARVRHAVQPGRAGGRRSAANSGRGTPISGPPRPKLTSPSGRRSERDAQGDVGGRQAGLAGDVEAPAQLDAEVAPRPAPGVLDGLAERLGRRCRGGSRRTG